MTRSRPARFLTSLSLWVLIALAAGLTVGALAQSRGFPGGVEGAGIVQSLGRLWLNGLTMTIIPLVFSLLVVGIAQVADAARSGRLALKALGVFLVLLISAIVYAFAASQGLHAVWPVDPEGARAILANHPDAAEVTAAARGSGVGAFLESLAPGNPVKAAADNAILAIVVFAIAFGFAATRIQAELRRPLVAFFQAVAETMIVIVHWVLKAAPFGVFALAFGVGLNTGLGAAGVLGHYIALVVLVQVGLIAMLYPVAALWGRVGPFRFARAAVPPQVVAFSTQSSLASLPAMVEAAQTGLGVSRATAGIVLPLAVALFRITSPVANLAVVLYIAHLYGISLPPAAYVAGGLTAFAVSVGSVGLPGQVSFFVAIAPICIAMGVPIELLPLFLAVEVIPDIFRTIGNVTADLAAARIVEGREADAPVG